MQAQRNVSYHIEQDNLTYIASLVAKTVLHGRQRDFVAQRRERSRRRTAPSTHEPLPTQGGEMHIQLFHSY
jgi:hypothetical protein